MESTTGQRLAVQNLEVAVLDRNRQGRKFRRLTTDEVTELIHPR